jgi:hypothetical protein
MDNRSNGRRKVLAAWGVLAGAAALLTAAAFSDAIYLNFGTGADGSGIGGGGTGKVYNLQVAAVNPDGTFKTDGTWMEADDPKGVNIKLPGAESLFPGSTPATVQIPIRNQSENIGSTLNLKLINTDPAKTSVDYLGALRFDIAMPAPHGGGAAIALTDKTFAELSAGVPLNNLAAKEASSVTVTVKLPDQGSETANNNLNGKAAWIQANLYGQSR